MAESHIPPPLKAAIEQFRKWNEAQLLLEQTKNVVEVPLYHYTDGQGLKGILESETFWFTDYRHLNDPSELTHGMDMAHAAARDIATGADGRVRIFLDCLSDMFSQHNFVNVTPDTLEFFIASFSRERDDLGQWRNYAGNGRGFALGLAPRIFDIEENKNPKPTDAVVVGPVIYDVHEAKQRHRQSLEEAAAIFLGTANANSTLVANKSIGIPFMQDMSREIIASPLIWNALTTKHPAYKHECEVRMIMLGQRKNLLPNIRTRLRGNEIVPYVPYSRPLRSPHSIVEIVVGPAAPPDAERTLRTLLDTLGVSPDVPIGRSDIPYRAL